MKFLKWLYPGLGVKRWLALSLLGFVLVGTGLAMMLNSPFVNNLAFQIRFLVFQLLGLLPSFVLGALVAGAGLVLALTGFHRMLASIIKVLLPREGDNLVEILYARRLLRRGPRIVAIGGGTGLSVLLRGLKKYTANITAIVAVSDDGGSSGRLRGELGILPPGDIRNCLVALADTEALMEELFSFRFKEGCGLAGHTLGNLFLAGMTAIAGGFDKAIQEMSKVLAVRGRVLPCTLDNVTLVAELIDGTQVEGETSIAAAGKPIRRIFLQPADCRPYEAALKAILEADAVVLGPGSLYTSILPNLVIPGMADALRRAKAPVFYVCNVMTEPGETDTYTASRHLKAIIDHCGPGVIDYVVVNTAPVSKDVRESLRARGVQPVLVDGPALARLGAAVIRAHVMDEENPLRHHPDRLAHAIMGGLFYRTRSRGRWNVFMILVAELLWRVWGRVRRNGHDLLFHQNQE